MKQRRSYGLANLSTDYADYRLGKDNLPVSKNGFFNL